MGGFQCEFRLTMERRTNEALNVYEIGMGRGERSENNQLPKSRSRGPATSCPSLGEEAPKKLARVDLYLSYFCEIPVSRCNLFVVK
jgi:hypothetical protein